MKVNFDAANGSVNLNKKVVEGEKIIEPTPAPTKSGYTFEGWYNGGMKWDFKKAPVTKAVKLQAKWTRIDVTLTSVQLNKFTLKSTSISGETEPNTVVELYRNGTYKKKVRSDSKWVFKLVLKVSPTSKSKFMIRSIDTSGNKKTYVVKAK